MNKDLSICNLTVAFKGPKGEAKVIEDANLTIPSGRRLALVGESGSGKTVIAKAILGLLPQSAAITSGQIGFGSHVIASHNRPTDTTFRGREISMIFQSPKSSLNPIRKIGKQIEDVLRQHTGAGGRETRQAALAALNSVRLPDPSRIYHAYPFELSGGMAQRALIALALACNPSLLIADEPTTGLDVSLQREIMDLIVSISAQRSMSLLLITHDLAVAHEYCDLVAVMHAGHVVETAPAEALFTKSYHPYTTALMQSTPNEIQTLAELKPIRGTLPDLYGKLPACRFLHRCEQRVSLCEAPPPIHPREVSGDHSVLCRRAL